MDKFTENDVADLLHILDFPDGSNKLPICDTGTRQLSAGVSIVSPGMQNHNADHNFKACVGQSVVKKLRLLLWKIINCNPLPQVELERLLDGLASIIKHQVTSTDVTQPWFPCTAQVTVVIVWRFPWLPKLHKKMIKVMVEMEKYDGILIEQLLNPWTKFFYQTAIDQVHLITWYGLVEVSAVARKLVGQNLKAVLALLNTNLGDLLNSDLAWTIERQQWLLLLLKVALQLFQQLPTEVRLLAYGTECMGESAFESLVSYIIRLLISVGIPSQCMYLAGTAIAFLICLCPDQRKGAEIFKDIFVKLGTSDVVRFGYVTIRVTPLNDVIPHGDVTSYAFTSFGHLSMLTGILPCAKASMLCHTSTDAISQMFATWLFDLVVKLCGVPEHQYHSFRLLTAWYQCVTNYSTDLLAADKQMFNMNSPVVMRTLGLVWTHLDSPVDGINELIIEAFKSMFKLHFLWEEPAVQQRTECEMPTVSGSGDGETGEHPGGEVRWSPLLEEVLSHTLSLPWSVKGKHHLVAALVPYIDVSAFIEKETDMFNELLSCCSTNYLGPPSTVLYRALLHRLTEKNSMAGFIKYLLPVLVKGLTGESCLLRQNVSQYWLVTTLKHNKKTYPLIFEYTKNLQDGRTEHNTAHIESTSRYIIHALVTIMKTGKAQQLLKNEWEKVVLQALQHQDDDIRLDAFAILCVSQKKAEPLSAGELELLRTYLPDNMSSDNAPFRQRMQASLRMMLARLRDGAIGYLRIKSASLVEVPMTVTDSLNFIEWFWEVIMRCLSPGASYQRLKTALDWALLVLDTFSYQPYRHQRKGSTPDTVRHLLAVAASRGQWAFYSPTNTQLILTCLLHGTDEIRELTGSILVNYFHWPLELAPLCTVTLTGGERMLPTNIQDVAFPRETSEHDHLLQTGFLLCNSAKPHETESGSLLIKMIFQKVVVEQQREIKFHITLDKEVFEKPSRAEESHDPELAARHFICHMVGLVQTSLANTQKDILQGARTTPMHGLLLMMRRCLCESGLKYMHPDRWVPVIKNLLSCVSDVIDVVMDVLGGKLHEDDTAPSFEEMGVAITATIAESSGNEVAHNTLLTSDQRLLMTWSWVNIKESSLLLGSLVEAVSLTTPSTPGILSHEQVTSIGHIFLKVLLQCRHRGAIEGCNMGLAHFCEGLLKSSDQQLHAIPKELLIQVLSQIQRSDVSLSVTRRSAGLPLIITSIITSESKTRQDVLLCHMIETLLCVAESPVLEADQRADLPIVHALNVLKAVLKEAAVATATHRYLARALIIAVEGFASQHWAIQNAATQLFGILVSRMLGQKWTHEDHADLMTLPEFLAHYPPMEEFLLYHLEQGAADQRTAGWGSLRLHPTTFPVLSILARLSAGNLTNDQYQTSITKFHMALTQLLDCPVYIVRELAARSLASLTPSDQFLSILHQVIIQLPADPLQIMQNNRLHGDVVLCSFLLDNLSHSATNQDLTGVLTLLTNKLWLASRPSSLVRARYVNLLLETIRLLKLRGVNDIPDVISACLKRHMQVVLHPEHMSVTEKVGWDQMVEPLVTWFLSPGSDPGGRRFVTCVKQCLTCTDADVVLTALKAVAKKMSTSTLSDDTWAKIQVAVRQTALSVEVPHCSVGAAALELLAQTRTQLEDLGVDLEIMWDGLMVMICQEMSSQQAGPALLLTATLIATDVESHNSYRLDSWGELLAKCCAPQNAEWLHLHAAKALTTLAPPIAAYLNQRMPDPALSVLTLRLFEAGVCLLVSEHVLVRQEAAYFVSVLQANVYRVSWTQPLHTAAALQVLCEVIFTSLGSNRTLLSKVIGLVRKPGPSLSHLVAQETKQYVEVLFEMDDGNYYREDVMLAQAFCSCLQTKLQKEAVDEVFTQALLRSILEELEEALPCLYALCSGSGPVNVSCRPRVYEMMWADLMIVSLMVSAPSIPHLQCKWLVHIMNQYAQMPFLHPHLQRTAQNVATEIQSRSK